MIHTCSYTTEANYILVPKENMLIKFAVVGMSAVDPSELKVCSVPQSYSVENAGIISTRAETIEWTLTITNAEYQTKRTGRTGEHLVTSRMVNY